MWSRDKLLPLYTMIVGNVADTPENDEDEETGDGLVIIVSQDGQKRILIPQHQSLKYLHTLERYPDS